MNTNTVIDRLPIHSQCFLRRIYYKYRYPKHYESLKKLRNTVTREGYSLKSYLEKKCIFIHIPKCAGISICKSLLGNLGGGHLTIRDYQAAFTPHEFVNFFKFTIVRNPWDRLVSAYNFLKRGGLNERDRLWAEENLARFTDFNEFVKNWVNRKNVFTYYHFRPQTYYVSIRNKPILDYIGYMDRIKQDYEFIAKKINVTAPLQHINKSDHLDYKKIYNSSSIEIVRKTYEDDIQIFGYTFEKG